jgi:hypothetical protein
VQTHRTHVYTNSDSPPACNSPKKQPATPDLLADSTTVSQWRNPARTQRRRRRRLNESVQFRGCINQWRAARPPRRRPSGTDRR